jgi:hypothetical protein
MPGLISIPPTATEYDAPWREFMRRKAKTIWFLCFIVLIFAGCAATKSDVAGLYTRQAVFLKKTPICVFFDFYHYKQEVGKDSIPKLLAAPGIVDFDDIFKESMKQLSNIESYSTFTNQATDIDQPKRREERASSVRTSDYMIKVEILREKSYSSHFIGAIVSTLSLTVIPIPYTWKYTATVSVVGRENETRAKYTRSASVTS